MPEYEVAISEEQTSRRLGIRRITADSPEEARRVAQLEHDDNETWWQEWGDGRANLSVILVREKDGQ